jgi:hypothetical protein
LPAAEKQSIHKNWEKTPLMPTSSVPSSPFATTDPQQISSFYHFHPHIWAHEFNWINKMANLRNIDVSKD